MTDTASPYDALLICSYGGPYAPDDVIPFLRNVTKGKGIPEERLKVVGEHYYRFGGKSPINEQNQALAETLTKELVNRGITLPIIVGNRNWYPYTEDTLRNAKAFGAKRILSLITSAYASYSGSRQYREHLAEVKTLLEPAAPEIDVLRPFYNQRGFITANVEAIKTALNELGADLTETHIAYVTHSIPLTMNEASAATGPSYLQQHEDVAQAIDRQLQEDYNATAQSSLSFCSRSGDPRVPWLEPDISDRIEQLANKGVKKIVIAPIGFISDHMEVIFDLDVEALEAAEEHDMQAVRAASVGTSPTFISSLADMITERATRERGETSQTPDIHPYAQTKPFPDTAPPGSCRMRPNQITGIPVLAGTQD